MREWGSGRLCIYILVSLT